MIKNHTTGLQHLGIPTRDLDESVRFYEALDFDCMYRKKIKQKGESVEVAFVKLHDLIIELYQSEDEDLETVKNHKDGDINHFAINVKDVSDLFEKMQQSEFHIMDDQLQYMALFDKGVSFFRIRGFNHEVIEFNQIL